MTTQVDKLPNLIIGGCTKCGTTSLFYWLAAHPQVCGSSVKETHFFHDQVLPRFNAGANIHQHSLSAYSRYFSHCSGQKVILEASPQYMFQKTALAHIPTLPSNPKVLFLLRDPVKRAFSQFVYSKYRLGRIPGEMTFRQYVEWSKLRGPQADVVSHSSYYKHISNWIERMGADRLIVVQSEQLFRNPKDEMMRLCDLLGIEPAFYEGYDFPHRNESSGIRMRWLHRMAQRLQYAFPESFKEKVLIPLYLKINADQRHKSETLSEEDAQWMRQMLKDDTDRLLNEFQHLRPELWYE